MSKALILVLSCQKKPYDTMVETSLNTWDSINVDGLETLFYYGEPVKDNTDKHIYFPVKEGLDTMGRKDIEAFEWVLKNNDFDFIYKVN